MDLFKTSEKENINPERMRLLDAVSANTDKLIDHVNKLIDISEIQQRTIMLQSEPFDLTQLLVDLIPTWSDLMAEKGVAFQVNDGGQSAWIKGDRARLMWALHSLVDNAYHYTLPDGRVTVNLTIDQTANEACIEVADTGIGIAAVDQPYIFTRFYRVENQSTFNETGVGLGLFIAKSLVEMHNGRIWVQSRPDEGSTFYITLPLALERDIERS
jgi:two-component system phosphate regulon sensor histidine kinase PhoR